MLYCSFLLFSLPCTKKGFYSTNIMYCFKCHSNRTMEEESIASRTLQSWKNCGSCQFLPFCTSRDIRTTSFVFGAAGVSAKLDKKTVDMKLRARSYVPAELREDYENKGSAGGGQDGSFLSIVEYVVTTCFCHISCSSICLIATLFFLGASACVFMGARRRRKGRRGGDRLSKPEKEGKEGGALFEEGEKIRKKSWRRRRKNNKKLSPLFSLFQNPHTHAHMA